MMHGRDAKGGNRNLLGSLLLRWIAITAALFATVWLVPGIEVAAAGWWDYAVAALVLGLINASVKPFLTMLTCPLILLTLGLFVVVLNAFCLWLTSLIADNYLGIAFEISGLPAALLGALVISAVTLVFSAVFR